MAIQYAVPIPEKSHVLHVGLLVPASVKEIDPVTGAVTMVDGIQEIPVRKSHYNSLTATQKLAYVRQCAEYHHPTDRAKRNARLAAWAADDKAAVEAKFTMRHVSTNSDNVTVSVTWQGLTAEHTIPNDPANATANAQAAHQATLDAKAEAELAVAAFNVG